MTSSNLGLTRALPAIYLFLILPRNIANEGRFSGLNFGPRGGSIPDAHKKTRRGKSGGLGKFKFARANNSLLPRALLVSIRLQALPALVLIHLQTTFLFQVAHGA